MSDKGWKRFGCGLLVASALVTIIFLLGAVVPALVSLIRGT